MVLDPQQIKGAALEEAVRQMPAAAVIAEAPSGKLILLNEQARHILEQNAGWSGLPEPEEIGDFGDLRMLHPDGRPVEMEEWPLLRSIRAGEEVRDEEYAYLLADGSRFTIRCDSSPIRDDEGLVVAGVLIVRDVTGQKRAEEQLAYHARLMENVQDAVIAMNERYVLTAWNKGAEELYGWAADEVLGRDVREVARSEMSDKQRAEALRELDETGRFRAEVISYRKDGTPVYVELTNVAMRGELGEITGYLGIHRDITERKRAEESRARYAAVLEATTDFVATTDPGERVLSVNQAGRRMLGIGEDEDVSNTTIADYHPEWAYRIVSEQGIPAAVRDGAWSGESALQSRDGREVPISQSIVSHKGQDGEEEYLSTVARDITERKRFEEERQRLVDIVQNSSDFIGIADMEWRANFLNEAGQRLVGLNGMEEVRRTTVPDYFMPEDQAFVQDELFPTVLKERHWAGERELNLRHFETGEPIPVLWDAFTIDDPETGEPIGFATVTRDITERKRAEREIETRTRQQAAVAELGLRALAGDGLQSLMDEAVACVARTLGVEFCKVVELLPGGEEVLLRAGVGFEEGLVGIATARVEDDPQVGYTLSSSEPVIVEDLGAETRFLPSPLLREYGMVSGMTVAIPGRDGPFGGMGAHTARRRTFSEDDANFLQAVANVLAAAAEREAAEAELNQVRESERGRIARDLHDEALGGLSYALAEAQLVQSFSQETETARRLERLVVALKGVGQQLRGAIHDLRLAEEQDRPFHELLEAFVELHRTMDPECDIRLDAQGETLSGSLGRTGTELLRIVREALTNARRHSEARNVRVAVRATEDRLWAEVSDDGRGWDPAREPSPTRGTGIRGMRERARALGGDLKITSEPGEGTKVRFELAPKEDREGPEERVSVLLVEDHAAVREAIAAAFEREVGFEVAGQAGSLAEARRMLGASHKVDVALIDLGLPDGYGGDLIKDLREAHPEAQPLVLSASLDRAEIARTVESGAAGVLHKTVHLDEVVEAVRRLRAGETLMPLEEVVELLRFVGSQRKEEYEAHQAIARLTPREREVLQVLAEGLDSEGIAERLHISLRTERNHIASILAKLGVHSQLQALVFALRHGLVEIH